MLGVGEEGLPLLIGMRFGAGCAEAVPDPDVATPDSGSAPVSLPRGDLDLVSGVNCLNTNGRIVPDKGFSSSLSLYLSTDLDLVNGVTLVGEGVNG